VIFYQLRSKAFQVFLIFLAQLVKAVNKMIPFGFFIIQMLHKIHNNNKFDAFVNSKFFYFLLFKKPLRNFTKLKGIGYTHC